MLDTRPFLTKLKSRKFLVIFAHYVIVPIIVAYAQEHPQLQIVISSALLSLGLGNHGYQLGQGKADAGAAQSNTNIVPT